MISLAVGPGFARSQRWLRAHPLALDAALAAVVLALIVLGSVTDPHGVHGPRFGERRPETSDLVLAVIACASLAVRRRAPLGVLAFSAAVSLAALVTGTGTGDHRAPVAMSVVIALYTVASRTDRPTTWRVGALTVIGLTAAAMFLGAGPWYGQGNLGLFAWTGMAAAAGDAVRSRRAFVDAIRERAERAERTREEEARRRVAEERMRIARELHDVVAHHIALVNVQAGVAAHVMDNRPDQAREALAHVREASRSALHELRATVGLLRQRGEPEAPTEPAPGLGVLDQLVDGFSRAGLKVEIEVSSTASASPAGPWHSRSAAQAAAVAGELPAAVDLTVYRVVQEALTNAHKHAGEHARAVVRIAREREALEVCVMDDGAGARAGAGGPGAVAELGSSRGGTPAPEAEAGGHGLMGMRERAAALGGVCETGRQRGGGFRVHVRLPLTGVREGAK